MINCSYLQWEKVGKKAFNKHILLFWIKKIEDFLKLFSLYFT